MLPGATLSLRIVPVLPSTPTFLRLALVWAKLRPTKTTANKKESLSYQPSDATQVMHKNMHIYTNHVVINAMNEKSGKKRTKWWFVEAVQDSCYSTEGISWSNILAGSTIGSYMEKQHYREREEQVQRSWGRACLACSRNVGKSVKLEGSKQGEGQQGEIVPRE